MRGGSWGGLECSQTVPLSTHILEAIGWITFCAISYHLINVPQVFADVTKKINSRKVKTNTFEKNLDVILGCIHMAIYLHLIYFKYNCRALLIVMFQPCHVILLLQGISLLAPNELGAKIIVFLLPSLIGTLLATFFPDTSGLDQFLERES